MMPMVRIRLVIEYDARDLQHEIRDWDTGLITYRDLKSSLDFGDDDDIKIEFTEVVKGGDNK
jgi:hypothetical protein